MKLHPLLVLAFLSTGGVGACKTSGQSAAEAITGPHGEPFEHLKVVRPSFAKILPLNNGQEKALLISTFGKDSSGQPIEGAVKIVRQLGQVDWADYNAPNSTKTLDVLDFARGVIWPNEVSDQATIGGRQVLAIAGGFFSPPLANPPNAGTITIVSTDHLYTTQPKVQLTVAPVEDPWFYHQVSWVDMDGDGNLDLLTARSNWDPFKDLFDKGLEKITGSLSWIPFIHKLKGLEAVKGEMVWFKNPGGDRALTEPWTKMPMLATGTPFPEAPDLFFTFCQVRGRTLLIAPAAWRGHFDLYWRKDESRPWSSELATRQLDMPLGSILFSVQCSDLNGDGVPDILLSNHEAKAADAKVYGLEVPEDLVHGDFAVHVLMDQIKTTKPGMGQSSPGEAQAFFPSASTRGKPWIVVSGDGAEQVYLLKPASQAADSWAYASEVIYSSHSSSSDPSQGSVTGGIAVGQVDETAGTDLFVPLYHMDRVEILKVKP